MMRKGSYTSSMVPLSSPTKRPSCRRRTVPAAPTAQTSLLCVNTALIDGVRKFINVRDLDIDLIDRINPFEAAYSVLARAMDETVLRQVQASISAKRVSIPIEEARELARRALAFKHEKSRLPDINSPDAWEKRMAEGVAALARFRADEKAREAAAHG